MSCSPRKTTRTSSRMPFRFTAAFVRRVMSSMTSIGAVHSTAATRMHCAGSKARSSKRSYVRRRRHRRDPMALDAVSSSYASTSANVSRSARPRSATAKSARLPMSCYAATIKHAMVGELRGGRLLTAPSTAHRRAHASFAVILSASQTSCRCRSRCIR